MTEPILDHAEYQPQYRIRPRGATLMEGLLVLGNLYALGLVLYWAYEVLARKLSLPLNMTLAMLVALALFLVLLFFPTLQYLWQWRKASRAYERYGQARVFRFKETSEAGQRQSKTLILMAVFLLFNQLTRPLAGRSDRLDFYGTLILLVLALIQWAYFRHLATLQKRILYAS